MSGRVGDTLSEINVIWVYGTVQYGMIKDQIQ